MKLFKNRQKSEISNNMLCELRFHSYSYFCELPVKQAKNNVTASSNIIIFMLQIENCAQISIFANLLWSSFPIVLNILDCLAELLRMINLHVSEFEGDDLVSQAAIFFTGGFETSSTTMSFTLHELAMNQDVQKTLRAEIHDALAKTDGKITYDMVR